MNMYVHVACVDVLPLTGAGSDIFAREGSVCMYVCVTVYVCVCACVHRCACEEHEILLKTELMLFYSGTSHLVTFFKMLHLCDFLFL